MVDDLNEVGGVDDAIAARGTKSAKQGGRGDSYAPMSTILLMMRGLPVPLIGPAITAMNMR
jgi:hypothetical protein